MTTLASTLYFAADASVKRYHAYRYAVEQNDRPNLKPRPITRRFDQARSNRSVSINNITTPEYRYPVYYNRATGERYVSGNEARSLNTSQTERLWIRNNQYKDRYGYRSSQANKGTRNKQLLDRSAYSTDMNGFITSQNVNRSRTSSLAWRVTEVSGNHSCQENSFMQCARNGASNFRSAYGLKDPKQNQAWQYTGFAWRQTVKNSFTYYPTFTESFSAKYNGRNNVYFLFSVYDAQNQKVVRVEGVARQSDMDRAAQDFYRVMQSFQLN